MLKILKNLKYTYTRCQIMCFLQTDSQLFEEIQTAQRFLKGFYESKQERQRSKTAHLNMYRDLGEGKICSVCLDVTAVHQGEPRNVFQG